MTEKRFKMSIARTKATGIILEHELSTDEVYNLLMEYKEENEQLKSEIINVIDRKIKNNDKNPPQDFQIYSKVNRALKDVRESLRDVIEDF